MILTFSTTKGGGGKTTTAICLGTQWAAKGHRIAFLDTDPTQKLATFIDRARKKGRIPELYERIHVVSETHDKSVPKVARGLDAEGYLVLIDVAGAESRAGLYATAVARLVIIPSGPSGADVDEAIQTVLSVRTTAETIEKNIPYCVSLNRIKTRTEVGRHALKQFARNNVQVLDQVLGHAVSFEEMYYSQLPPNVNAPVSMPAFQVRTLCREIEKLLPDFPKPTLEPLDIASRPAPPPRRKRSDDSDDEQPPAPDADASGKTETTSLAGQGIS